MLLRVVTDSTVLVKRPYRRFCNSLSNRKDQAGVYLKLPHQRIATNRVILNAELTTSK